MTVRGRVATGGADHGPVVADAVPGLAGAGLVVADLGVAPAIRRSRWAAMDDATRAGVCRLRGQEGDGLDGGGHVEHLWVPDVDGPVCYLRLVRRPGVEASIDLLATAPDVASLGVLSVLLLDVVARYGADPLVVTGRDQPGELLQRYGFAPDGPGRRRRAPEAPWR